MRLRRWTLCLGLCWLGALACSGGTAPLAAPSAPPAAAPAAPAALAAPVALSAQGLHAETVVDGLAVPWALAWAPDGRLFFNERPGRVRVVEGGVLRPEPVATLPVSQSTSEGGLLGLALAPDFAQSSAFYVYYTYDAAGGQRNRVSRLRLADGQAGDEQVILDGIPGANVHDGGRIAFGPDGKLYVGTGDATRRAEAQDPATLNGKILRLNPDGSVPDDNPFPGSFTYSFGNRNVQGLAWRPGTGQLYAAEHGPTGENGWYYHDEINLIVPGGNYGWPEVIGQAGDPRFLDPVVQSGDAGWPPGGLAFDPAGDLWLASLAGGQLWRYALTADGAAVADRQQLIAGEYGRLRALALGPDGALYVATSNRDGRGRPAPADDRILRLTLGPD
ncbi:MAG TPA: PQQ-dependent sugar dehydrogenase [Chloroflexota bacterium]|jgi:glucose/arabinose dehydrogenase